MSRLNKATKKPEEVEEAETSNADAAAQMAKFTKDAEIETHDTINGEPNAFEQHGDELKRKADIVDKVQDEVDEIAAAAPKPENDRERVFVLKQGSDATYPIRYPNGEIVAVVFRNGTKRLTGRLSDMFYAEYMANANMRMKVGLSDNAIADKVAANYKKSNPRTAHPGLDSAHTSNDLKDRIKQDAQMRNMQQRAAAGESIEEVIAPIDMRTTLEA